MPLSPSAPTTSPLPRQLLRYVPSQLIAALNRPSPFIALPSAPRGVDAAASQRLRAASRGAACPKRRPGATGQGSGGQAHSVPAMATTARVVIREPTSPGLPAQDGADRTHAATPPPAHVVMGAGGGPAPSSGLPTQVSGGEADAALAAVSLAVRRPKQLGPPEEGSGGSGGIIHAAVAAADS